ncbi:DUF2157 domain-containing protein [Agitococcus lubricus]|uniref:Putative membrane protein DUF2157 n=1 Tax=Agitococcus lubricus TaxID=1077255 RepID=A0A2T5J1M4_9GAMM|nr:DUF2157 domain-containing protein [Agitococcus lubricus]PTQ90344.1 putative membrane protein DUF2157 [Agitococcus lubricus]
MASARHKALLIQWLKQKQLAPDKSAEALAVADIRPPAHAWQGFIDKLLLINGAALLLVGILFFFAFNWQAITRFHKFAALELLIVVSVIAYYRFSTRPSAHYLILAASVLVGVLLALYGQTYQTGADTWQLFASWALLISPWVWLAKLPSLWLLWLLLGNISLILYYQTFHGLLGVMFGSHTLLLTLFLFNSLSLAVWEWAAKTVFWLQQGRQEPRLLAVMTGFSSTWLMLSFIFNPDASTWYCLVLYGVWLLGGYAVYRYRIPDVFMLAGGCLSLILVSSVWWTHLFFKNTDGFALLLISFWVMITSGYAVRWLKIVAQEWQHHDG